jgi:hypothetical protein
MRRLWEPARGRGALLPGLRNRRRLITGAVRGRGRWTGDRGVSREQLRVYLDESVFRHDRRGNPQAAFQTLLGLGTGRGRLRSGSSGERATCRSSRSRRGNRDGW